MRSSYFWAIIIAFLVGVGTRSFFDVQDAVLLFVCLLGLISVVCALFTRTGTYFFIILALCIGSCVIGVSRMEIAQLEPSIFFEESIGSKIEIAGVVVEEPDIREGNVRLNVRVDSYIGGTARPVGLLVIAPLHTQVFYGDEVLVKGTLNRPESFETGAGREFNYPGYLAKSGIQYELSFSDVTATGNNEGYFIKRAAIGIKRAYLDGLAAVLPEPHAGLAGGITAGDKRGLGKDLTRTFQVVGLMHIVVLSGYNIMVVLDAIGMLLFRLHRTIRFGVSIFVALLFVLMTGAASSSVRAAAMALIAIVGKLTGREYIALRVLSVVALCMVVWNPYVLIFDPGFQLSILATFGLVSFSGYISNYIQFITSRFGLREIASATLSTQIAVLPLLLYQNGIFSLYALPANLFALVVLPWAMLAAFIAGISGAILGAFGLVIAAPAILLLSYIIEVAELFAALPFSTIQFGAIHPIFMIIAYGVVFGIVLYQKSGPENRDRV